MKKLIKRSLFALEIPINAMSEQSPGSPVYFVGTKMSFGSNTNNKDLEF